MLDAKCDDNASLVEQIGQLVIDTSEQMQFLDEVSIQSVEEGLRRKITQNGIKYCIGLRCIE